MSEENKKTNSAQGERKGIRLLGLNAGMLTIAVLLVICALATNMNTRRTYREMQEATERYISLQREARAMESASDYLTEQVRAFAATGDPKYVDLYFEETDVTRRRDIALEVIQDAMSDSVSAGYLRAALEGSNALEQIEYYSMRLMIASRNYQLSDYPERLQEITLSAEDRSLSSARLAARAASLLYDETYQEYKALIRRNVEKCTDTLIEITRGEQLDSSERLLQMMRLRSSLVFLLLILLVLNVFTSLLLVVRPLQKISEHIRSQEPLPLTGSAELRLLEETYNTIFEENRKNSDKLSFDATHDSLTGLNNRSVFERERLAAGRRNIAMILVDVDYFKNFNDTFGHATGDLILQKVAASLQRCFRSEDFVCRIGGDEFAVIMVHASKDMKPLLEQKMAQVAGQLQNTDDGLPPVTLSVGIAFTDREDPESDIYKNADKALYLVKEKGRNGLEFYSR